MSPPVIFILGAGPGIGSSVANAFASKGYEVALAARSFDNSIDDKGYLLLKLDLANTEDIEGAFEKVADTFGIPSVVVYNGALRIQRASEDPLSSITIDEARTEFAVNVLTPLFTAKEAVKGFKQLPTSTLPTFIMTGNLLNVGVSPAVTVFGMGKTSAAHLIKAASIAYSKDGFQFYYADQRQEDGGPSIPVEGEVAGQTYVELAERKEQGPWDYTFVKGKGYASVRIPGFWNGEAEGS
ncbi:hypothetical protein FKW77_003759 [Venturia effusa]|uniref:Short chain type dehydrogenase n=1 Tax=Venturia effusa TaxID=50376 RepID=A0A517LK24_9PEZI|nr:hypothetical protein FKW77_003759 [Venturia effusa]